MRKSLAIVKATALEILSEPLTLLVLLSALVLAVIAPVFHYHQFGEPTRMARDAGVSALYVSTLIIAFFSPIRALRREIESGTMEMALAHPISRAMFFLSKVVGVVLSLLVIALIVFALTVTMVVGAAEGGRIAERSGTLSFIPVVHKTAASALLVLPCVIAAALNRFARRRFVMTAIALTLFAALVVLVASSWREGFVHCLKLLPVAWMIFVFSLIIASAASAFAVRYPANAAAAATGLVVAALMPFVGNYVMTDALAKGGTISLSYVAYATLAALPAIIAFVMLGVNYVRRYDH